jgi:hypothetical protein
MAPRCWLVSDQATKSPAIRNTSANISGPKVPLTSSALCLSGALFPTNPPPGIWASSQAFRFGLATEPNIAGFAVDHDAEDGVFRPRWWPAVHILSLIVRYDKWDARVGAFDACVERMELQELALTILSQLSRSCVSNGVRSRETSGIALSSKPYEEDRRSSCLADVRILRSSTCCLWDDTNGGSLVGGPSNASHPTASCSGGGYTGTPTPSAARGRAFAGRALGFGRSMRLRFTRSPTAGLRDHR